LLAQASGLPFSTMLNRSTPIKETTMSTIGATEIVLILIFVLIALVIFRLVPFWQIFKKAGFNPLLSLLMVVPLAHLVMTYYLAFSKWPNVKEEKNVSQLA
jgi:hypothetical protein